MTQTKKANTTDPEAARNAGARDAGLRVEGLRVVLGERAVLDGLDLEIELGERVVLVGRSGSGKSTLLRVLAGFQAADAGDVHLCGTALVANGRHLVPPQARPVGSLFQGGGLWPHMTVRRTLDFALKHRGVPRSERPARVRELVERVELVGYEDRLPGTLSGGEAQRLGLARALSTQPRLLLLDEPLGPLDAELRESLSTMLDRLRDEYGFAALHVTHDPGEARGSRTRTVRLVDGVLVDASPTGTDE
ncbi:Sulfate/thiosulfate import ATP-binding protein CysA [Planctomycetes bacterium Pla163]|uniref:Sulfate/thiosulfate import ATP-binding protein CysA n=1 Tax=Rohdeia mirabilis TaxID=2528008 RepID=A0A518D123_9BACT|nr:Sulfate/thiosulfate import ATP-binding protein CysA [Planctomycetes bacterium Pla163]